MKRILTVLGAIAAMLIPTYIALIIFFSGTSGYPVIKDLSYAQITDPNGKVFVLSGKLQYDELSELLYDMSKHSQKVGSIPEDIDTYAKFQISVISAGANAEFEYYFSLKNGADYFSDSSGNIRKINSKYAERFLSSTYASGFYENAVPPILTMASICEIVPESAEWKYKMLDQKLHSAEVSCTSNTVTYQYNGDLTFEFDKKPDKSYIKISDGPSTLFSGALAAFDASTVAITESTVFEISAEWSSSSEYRGNIRYKFSVDLLDDPKFSINTDSVYTGEYFVLSVSNATVPDKITFSSYPSINASPIFFKDGDYCRAILPISTETPAGEYIFALGYGSSSTAFSVKIDRQNHLLRDYDSSSIPLSLDSSIMDSHRKLISKIGNSYAHSTKYFSGEFIDFDSYSDIDAMIYLGFGHSRNATSNNFTYSLDGVDFIVYQGTNIPACNNGIVVYTGHTDYLGNFVVVEHGWGLKTWYAHLNEITVTEGTTVSKGQTIGTAGKTGFTNQSGVYLITTILGTPVSPYSLWQEGLIP